MTSTKSLSVAFTTTLLTLTTTTLLVLDVKAFGSDPSIDKVYYSSSRDFRNSMNHFFDELVRKRRELSGREDEEKEGFLDFEKDAMLLIHNSYRSVVAPTAANMVEVTWDNDIETFAQNWADQCGGDHRTNRDLNDWKNMGENLYWWTEKTYDEKRPVESWFNERRFYTFDTPSCMENGEEAVCSHYLTVAWAKTQKIGCGINRCPNLKDTITSPVYYFVCNYNAEFLSNTKPYEKGTACSNCPAEFPKCRYNMCVTQAMLDGCQGYNGTVKWVDIPRPSTKSDAMNCPGFAAGNEGGDSGDDARSGDGAESVDGAKSVDSAESVDAVKSGDDAVDRGDNDDDGGIVDDTNDGGEDTDGDDDDDSGVSLAASLFAILTTTILSVTIITSARL